MARLRLQWPRDLDGYEIEQFRSRSGRTLGEGGGSDDPPFEGLYIVALAQRAQEIHDPLKIDGVWRRLADAEPTAEGALGFVKSFGFLTSKRRRESVAFICQHIEAMRSIVAAIDREDWTTLDLWLTDNRKALRLHPVFLQEEGWPRPDLFFAPNTLLDAIYLQALQDATSGTELEKCDRPACPEWFAVGPGTGHARVKRPVRYCTPKCQKAHAYTKKKGVAK